MGRAPAAVQPGAHRKVGPLSLFDVMRTVMPITPKPASQSLLRALFVAAVPALASTAATAAIAPGGPQGGVNASYSGNGELFFAIQDSSAAVSYTLDLGITLNDFFISGQPDGGTQLFWAVEDPQWAQFAAVATRANMQWAVMGRDTTGGTGRGFQRWFTTVKQGEEANITGTTNLLYSAGLADSAMNTFFNGTNVLGTHGTAGVAVNYATNGSNFATQLDNKSAYFGSSTPATPSDSAVRPRINNLLFSITNGVGQSSWFYNIFRSGTDQLAFVEFDEFDNLGHDGYWGFTYVEPTVDSPYAGKYLLSYTMQAALATATQREFANSIGRTEWNGGFGVTRLGLAGTAEIGRAHV